MRMCSHPNSDLLYLVTIGSLATRQILAQLVNRILRYGDWVHVRTCRDAPIPPMTCGKHLLFSQKNTLFHIHNNTNIVKSAPSRLPLLVNEAKPGRFTRTIRDNMTTQCMFLDMTQLSTYNKLINSLTNTANIFGFVQP